MTPLFAVPTAVQHLDYLFIFQNHEQFATVLFSHSECLDKARYAKKLSTKCQLSFP